MEKHGTNTIWIICYSGQAAFYSEKNRIKRYDQINKQKIYEVKKNVKLFLFDAKNRKLTIKHDIVC